MIDKLSNGLKSFAVVVFTILLTVLLLPISGNVSSVYAANCGEPDDSNFLSFPTWYRNLECDSEGHVDLEGQEIGHVAIVVALNIVDIVLRMLSIVAIGFIIYGGFQYLIARGEPANMAKGKATITHAVVGLIIGIASAGIVGFVSSRLG